MRGGEEWNWISVCIFLYLACVIPPIWFLEYNEYINYQKVSACNEKWGNDDPGCKYIFGHWKDWSDKYNSINDLTANKTEFQTRCDMEGLFLNHPGQFLNLTTVFDFNHYTHNYEVHHWANGDDTDKNRIMKETKHKIDWDIYKDYRKQIEDKKAEDRKKLYERECKEVKEDWFKNADEEELFPMDHKCADYMFPTTAPYVEPTFNPMQLDPNSNGGVDENGNPLGDLDLGAVDVEQFSSLGKGLVGESSSLIDDYLYDLGIEMSTRGWINIFHQFMLFFIIFGRWMIPRARKVSRDHLSQILLTFIGIAADMLEFVTETRKDLEIACSATLLVLILGIWTWSTFQFFIVITGSAKPTTKQVPIFDSKHASPIMWIEEDIDMGACERFIWNPEVWGICTTLFMQDMPFLIMRLYVIFGKNVWSPMLVFFTLKNGVVFTLQIYRGMGSEKFWA